jgi:hypothetical protein
MSNFECTVTITDIYGAEWWERNREQLDREWEWGFGVAAGREERVLIDNEGIEVSRVLGYNSPRIILHRRKPKPPTLREVYGMEEVKIPVGWEWTGEWRFEKKKDDYLTKAGVVLRSYSDRSDDGYRLILRERPKKVWFKAEERERLPQDGDWIWYIDLSWKLVEEDLYIPHRLYLCATRHEEIDSTVQVVTQEDIDKCGR